LIFKILGKLTANSLVRRRLVKPRGKSFNCRTGDCPFSTIVINPPQGETLEKPALLREERRPASLRNRSSRTQARRGGQIPWSGRGNGNLIANCRFDLCRRNRFGAAAARCQWNDRPGSNSVPASTAFWLQLGARWSLSASDTGARPVLCLFRMG
jgi:hypothetical protein